MSCVTTKKGAGLATQSDQAIDYEKPAITLETPGDGSVTGAFELSRALVDYTLPGTEDWPRQVRGAAAVGCALVGGIAGQAPGEFGGHVAGCLTRDQAMFALAYLARMHGRENGNGSYTLDFDEGSVANDDAPVGTA